jgi:hypothetical protein
VFQRSAVHGIRIVNQRTGVPDMSNDIKTLDDQEATVLGELDVIGTGSSGKP